MKQALFIILIAVFFVACAPSSYKYSSIDPSFTTEDKNLKELAQTHKLFWEYFSAKEFEKTYQMELPHLCFQKSFNWYKNFFEPNRKGYKINLVSIKKIDDDRAVITHKYKDEEENEFLMEDRWVLVNGKWRHYFEFSKLPATEFPF